MYLFSQFPVGLFRAARQETKTIRPTGDITAAFRFVRSYINVTMKLVTEDFPPAAAAAA